MPNTKKKSKEEKGKVKGKKKNKEVIVLLTFDAEKNAKYYSPMAPHILAPQCPLFSFYSGEEKLPVALELVYFPRIGSTVFSASVHSFLLLFFFNSSLSTSFYAVSEKANSIQEKWISKRKFGE